MSPSTDLLLFGYYKYLQSRASAQTTKVEQIRIDRAHNLLALNKIELEIGRRYVPVRLGSVEACGHADLGGRCDCGAVWRMTSVKVLIEKTMLRVRADAGNTRQQL